MKRVLIITSLVDASPRIPGLSKYLPEFGWQPIIITPPVGKTRQSVLIDDCIRSMNVVEVPYHDPVGWMIASIKQTAGMDPTEGAMSQLRMEDGPIPLGIYSQLIRFFKEIAYYPDQERFWRRAAIAAGQKLLKEAELDAMVSSSSPVTSHLVARVLKAGRNSIPWIADLRDLWSQNHNYPYGWIRRALDRSLEVRTLSTADALTTVSAPLVNELRRLHRHQRMYAITNGFDPEEAGKSVGTTSKFTITYTGQIYRGRQDPTKILSALSDLLSEGSIRRDDLEIRFYGWPGIGTVEEVERYGLSPVTRFNKAVPRSVSLQKQRESQVLLVMNWEDPEEKGVVPLKVFEYLAAGRPILATGGFGGDMVEQILRNTKAGIYARDVESIKAVLKGLYTEYRANGRVGYNGVVEEIDKFSYRGAAGRLASILDALLT